jgi:hypothetical protein
MCHAPKSETESSCWCNTGDHRRGDKHSMCNTGQRARPEISRQNNSGQTQREAMGKRLREEVSDLILGGSEFWERQF